MKKSSLLFIFFIAFSMEAWGGILEITDHEMLNRNFKRILNNLENFYRVNADQIKVLNVEEFFQKPTLLPSFKAREALAQIRKNDKASITGNYSQKPRKLKKHLLELKEYFSSFDGNDDPELKQQVSDIMLYTNSLLLILKAVWR